MRKDVYDTYLSVADWDKGDIDWSEVTANMRV